LAQQFPVVLLRFGEAGVFLVIKLRQLLLPDQASKGSVEKAQARVELVQFGGGQLGHAS
jgi:hypothetical protein